MPPRSELPRQLQPYMRRLAILALLVVGLLASGTIGFVLTEGASVGFGFVWTLDTVATVGSIQDPTSTGGHVVKVLLIVFGVGTLLYVLVTVTEFFVAGHLGELLEERRTVKLIHSPPEPLLDLRFGRVGPQVARDLRAA